MFHGGELVVYGSHGVCRVAGKEKQLVNRKRTEYFILHPLSNMESRFMVPADNPTALAKLKPVLPREEMEQLLNSEQVRADVWIGEENRRKQEYRGLINSGDRLAVLQMVHAIYRYRDTQLAVGRRLHLCDENFLRDAEKLMASEIGLVYELDQDQAKLYLREKLNG